MSIIRTVRGTYTSAEATAWGTYWRACPDPDAVDTDTDVFTLAPDVPLIPWRLWGRVIELYMELVSGRGDSDEVSVILLRGEPGGPNDGQWRICVPRQLVGGVSIRSNVDDMADIETGEHLTCTAGWVFCGSSHSHNRMGAFFSRTDDESELSVNGCHIVVGSIETDASKGRTYTPLASIVHRGRRWIVPYRSLIECEPGEHVKPHSGCFKMIERETTFSGGDRYGPASIAMGRDRRRDDRPRRGRHGGFIDGADENDTLHRHLYGDGMRGESIPELEYDPDDLSPNQRQVIDEIETLVSNAFVDDSFKLALWGMIDAQLSGRDDATDAHYLMGD